ncbi:hypothetical protein F5879DRAFT_179705 [Lentinula edodes]|nr:hypothetical protein HHX47_DHR2001199 [Lentinula edodes]KAJ3903085.1 hypothetical protein F5879DRAFT_179705 [Lentinula edodes]
MSQMWVPLSDTVSSTREILFDQETRHHEFHLDVVMGRKLSLFNTMPDLPQELIDRFIDDLKNLSLVSKSWLPRARYHIFRFITLAPQDLERIREHYAYLEHKASAIRNGRYYHHPFPFAEQRLLHSSLFGYLHPQTFFVSSLRDTLHLVQGLQLESFIQVGRGRRISPQKYFDQWLGIRGQEFAQESILMRDLYVDDKFNKRQKDRWNAVVLPWGHRAGLHALPFRCMRYLQIRWSVFSWIPSCVLLEGEESSAVHALCIMISFAVRLVRTYSPNCYWLCAVGFAIFVSG